MCAFWAPLFILDNVWFTSVLQFFIVSRFLANRGTAF